jgi:hypothetical protein
MPEQSTKNVLCDRGDCPDVAVAVIPLPDLHGIAREINVCERHFESAVKGCYFVVRFDENENVASSRHDRLVNERHVGLRGSDVLFVEGRSGKWIGASA